MLGVRAAAERALHSQGPVGARRSKAFTLDDLPDRVDAPQERVVAPPEPEWPPLALNVLDNMRKFPNCLLLTRVGGFYESYFEQAPQLAADISIKLATRRWAGQVVPMSGFPIHQLDKYLKVLVQEKGRLVAICEEFKESPSSASFSRRVTRIVSPGTLIDERFLDPFSNNFILALSKTHAGYGIAWLDVSTADFQTGQCADEKEVRDEIVRIQPREVVLVDGQLGPDAALVYEAMDMIHAAVAAVEPRRDALDLRHVPAHASDAERDAIAVLTYYLETRLMEHMPGLHIDTSEGTLGAADDQVMHLDAHTLGALEIRETARDGSVRGSLTSIVRRTMTQGGTRLLTQWLAQPSTSIPLIRARHALVDWLLQRPFLRKDLRTLLRGGVGDILRTLQRISLRRNDEQDLLEVRDFVRTSDALVQRLQAEQAAAAPSTLGWTELGELLAKFQSLHALGERLGGAIDERVIEKRIQRQEAMEQSRDVAYGGGATPTDDPPKRRTRKSEPAALLLDGDLWGDDFEHLIRPDASPVLRAFTDEHTSLRKEARRLENALRTEFQEPVTLRFLLGQGHVVHFASARGAPSDAPLSLAYKTKTTRTYYHAGWTKIGMKLQKLAARLSEREAESLEMLRQEVLQETAALRRNARLIDQLDVLLSFAQAAEELHLTRPTVDDSTTFTIHGGRHLAVEMGLLERQRLFTKNDLVLGHKECMHLVTGPNMGGKSTFLRQNAILSVLAQAGSFVPAEAAHLGVVDRIFSRVGAKDDLFHSRSTFMVEMAETAEILRRATPRSFVIADEIGRGTNTSVGLSIAFGTLHTLATRIGCRSLFATHYYELADLLESAETAQGAAQDLARRVAFVCTTLETCGEGLRYSHKVRPGVNRTSHGLDVARLADMPHDTMDLAARTHAWLERHGGHRIPTQGLVTDVLS